MTRASNSSSTPCTSVRAPAAAGIGRSGDASSSSAPGAVVRFSAARTIFHNSTTPLTLWFHTVMVFSNAKSGISAKTIERDLEVTYKCAWRMLRVIRQTSRQSGRGCRAMSKWIQGTSVDAAMLARTTCTSVRS